MSNDAPLNLRIFLSSPGDVSEERQIVQKVLADVVLQPLLGGKVFIETVAWDDPHALTPLLATESPQQSVNRFKRKPSECDLTIAILWSRLGTALPPDQRKPDGSTYASGTEWEIEDARNAGKKVLVYRRTTVPTVSLEDPDPSEKLRQYAAVKQFFATFRNPDGSAAGGFNDYDSPKAFQTTFENHIELYLRNLLDIEEASDLDKYRYDFGDEQRAGASLVGRDDVWALLASCERSHPCGYVRLTADAGLGKTALAAAVAAKLGAQAFFTSATSGLTKPDQCLNHLTVELIARFALPHRRLPARAGDTSAYFEQILAEAARKAYPDHVWIVVDAIDEADAPPVGNPLLLPADLPAGVFCFVTQRPGDTILTVSPTTSLVDHAITPGTPSHQADVRKFLEREVSRQEIADALRAAMPGHDTRFFVSELAKLSEGNFMYLSYLMRDLAAGQWSFEQPDGSPGLPKGLREYYAAIWRRMEATTQADGGQEWRTLYRPVIGLLAVAGAPVSAAWLAEISGCDPEDVQNPVLAKLRRFLHHERLDQTERWRILHRAFGEFLADKLDLGSRHAAVARHFDTPSSWATYDAYASRHLTDHLRAIGNLGRLAQLVADAAWYESQLAADGSGVRFERDLRETWALAASVDAEAAGRDEVVPALHHEIECALGTITLRGFWMSIPSDTVDTLLRVGILSETQALGFIEQIPDAFVRTRAITGVADALSDASLPRAVDVARSIDDASSRVEALLALAGHVSAGERAPLIEEALVAARAMEAGDSSRADLLFRIGAMLEGDDRASCWADAAAEATALENSIDRAHALAPMIVDVPQTFPALQQALQDLAAQARDGDDVDGEVLAEVVERVPIQRRPDVAREAVPLVGLIVDPRKRVAGFTGLVAALAGPERQQAVTAALEAARSIADATEKANDLLDLAKAIPAGSARRDDVVAEAAQCIETFSAPTEHVRGLVRLAAHLPEQQSRSCIARAVEMSRAIGTASERVEALVESAEELPDALRDVALDAARGAAAAIPDRFSKARALMQIAQEWSGGRMRQLTVEATRIPGGILAIGRPESDDFDRAELLGVLAPELSGSQREAAMHQLQTIAESLKSPYQIGRVRAKLLALLDLDDRSRVVADVRTLAAVFERPDERADVLTVLLPHASADERPAAFQDVLEAARAIEPNALMRSGTVDMRTGFVSIDPAPAAMGHPSLALLDIARLTGDDERRALVAEALGDIRDLRSEWQAQILLQLSSELTATQVRGILIDYRRVLRDPLRDEYLRYVKERLEGIASAPPVNATEGDPPSIPDIEGLNWFVPVGDRFRLNRQPDQAAFRIRYSVPPAWSSPELQEKAERSLIRQYADQLVGPGSSDDLEKERDTAQAFQGFPWQRSAGALLRRLAATDSNSAALEEARAIWADHIPPPVVPFIARQLPSEARESLLREACEAAQLLHDPSEQATLLISLLPHLDDPTTTVEAVTHAVGQLSARQVLAVVDDTEDLDALPSPIVLALVQRVLATSETRRELFVALKTLLPALKRLAGPSIVGSLADVVLRSNRWTL